MYGNINNYKFGPRSAKISGLDPGVPAGRVGTSISKRALGGGPCYILVHEASHSYILHTRIHVCECEASCEGTVGTKPWHLARGQIFERKIEVLKEYNLWLILGL